MLPFIVLAFVLVAAIAVISYPLVFSKMESYLKTAPIDSEFSERDALLEALSELELSFQIGKLSESDYQTQKIQLEQQYLTEVDNLAK